MAKRGDFSDFIVAQLQGTEEEAEEEEVKEVEVSTKMREELILRLKVWKTLEQSYGKEELESKKEQAASRGQLNRKVNQNLSSDNLLNHPTPGRLYQRTTSLGALSEASSMPAASAFRYSACQPSLP